MTDEIFFGLWQDALEQPDRDIYISKYSYPDWFNYNGINMSKNETIAILENIHHAAHMTVKDIISLAGLTQHAFSTKFCIPLRTIENWVSQKGKCPDYLRLLFCRQLGIIKEYK